MRVFGKLMGLLSAVILVFSSLSLPVLAQELTSGFSVSTALTINNYPLVNNGSYGEGKFYVNPTFTFDDTTVLNNGDTLVYPIPSVFQLERLASQDITAPNGQVIAKMVADPATGKATVTITDAAYFTHLNEQKQISFLMTVVWNDATPYNVPQTFTFLGAPTYTLTRIKVDEEPQGYSKWGTQDKANPNYINWRIRVNRDINNFGQVVIKDVIPEGQELDGGISGYYFADWNNGPRTSFPTNAPSIVTITDANHFTINAGDLSNRGIYIIYRTFLTGPVDKVSKKAFNDIQVTSNGNPLPALASRPFAPLSVTDGVGSGVRSDEAKFVVNKTLAGRNLQANEFTFELVDDATGNVLQTVKNAADGTITFEKLKFSTVGNFSYTIREVASGLANVTDDPDPDIKVSVKVTESGGAKQATTTYDRTSFINTYTVTPITATVDVYKSLEGRTLQDGEFEFILKDQQGQIIERVSNLANEVVPFSDLVFYKPGRYIYTVEEVDNQLPGVTYDTTPRTLYFDIEQDPVTGSLYIAHYGPEMIFFQNTFKPEPLKVNLDVVKTLDGRPLLAGEFEFVLKDETGKEIERVTNQASGQVIFSELAFSSAGTYRYTVEEVNNQLPGVTYDSGPKEITFQVAQNPVSGQLELAQQSPAGQVLFENVYLEPTTMTVTPEPTTSEGTTVSTTVTPEPTTSEGTTVSTTVTPEPTTSEGTTVSTTVTPEPTTSEGTTVSTTVTPEPTTSEGTTVSTTVTPEPTTSEGTTASTATSSEGLTTTQATTEATTTSGTTVTTGEPATTAAASSVSDMTTEATTVTTSEATTSSEQVTTVDPGTMTTVTMTVDLSTSAAEPATTTASATTTRVEPATTTGAETTTTRVEPTTTIGAETTTTAGAPPQPLRSQRPLALIQQQQRPLPVPLQQQQHKGPQWRPPAPRIQELGRPLAVNPSLQQDRRRAMFFRVLGQKAVW